jgi:hypothetical protein
MPGIFTVPTSFFILFDFTGTSRFRIFQFHSLLRTVADLASKDAENFFARTQTCHKFPCEFISSLKMAPVALLEGSLFDFTLTHPDNKPWALSDLKGSAKAVLLVNTASECGYTPQFGPLGELHNEYKDRGLVVVGVPSNDFGSQEHLASDKIPEFCAKNSHCTEYICNPLVSFSVETTRKFFS